MAEIRAGQLIDAVQTAGIIVVALAIVYAIHMLRHELRQARLIVRQLVDTQNQTQENVRRVWERIDALEARQGIQGEADTFIRMKRLLDAFEAGGRDPPQP